ncbi:MAG: hypothetical protein JW821_14245 [Deltaproteobacteria bacterium]|nr:hypothetical protein [Deltaproteobacteria bacterium]
METKLYLDIHPQPDQSTCGPTCLHAVYRYYGDFLPLPRLIEEVDKLPDGGTLAVYLACHALARGYRATIWTYNLRIFDPSWFKPGGCDMREKLLAQAAYKVEDPVLGIATEAYLKFLDRGGRLRFEVLTPRLIRRFLNRSVPILTGLSATYLYDGPRERSLGDTLLYDDVRGESTGHFVVLGGYDRALRQVLVADPLLPNPLSSTHYYAVDIYRLICAIMMGVLSHDGNLLVIESPNKRRRGKPRTTTASCW